MKKSEVDVAVLLLFFTRVEITRQTFAQIKKARPARLYLYQDGPRNEKDMPNILKCREIVEDIDWECEVHQMYQEKNYGCDPSEFISQRWMFEHEDKGIVIEDDDVMAVSFFKYCKDLLDRYENDERVSMICGMNNLEVYPNCPNDYFFVREGGSICGWASWKRVVNSWDSKYEFLNDEYTLSAMRSEIGNKMFKTFTKRCKAHLQTGREHYESIFGSNQILQGRYNIVPTRNMTKNIGFGEESTHSVSSVNLLPRSIRKIFYMNTYELSFPLKHPKYIAPDYTYTKLLRQRMYGNWFARTFQLRLIESLLYRMFPFLGK